jgi:hypothetical protein
MEKHAEVIWSKALVGDGSYPRKPALYKTST